MEKRFLFLPKTGPFPAFFIFIFSLLFLLSCQSNKEKQKPDDAALWPVFKMNCTMLSRAQIQTWVDSGWTKPGDPVTKILLQFYSEDTKKANKNMQLAVYPSKGYLKAYRNGEQFAAIDKKCKELKLESKVIFGNNYFTIKNLKLFKPDGTLEKFDYLKIMPQVGRDGKYLTFKAQKIELIGTEEKMLDTEEESDPCPTFCPDEESN